MIIFRRDLRLSLKQGWSAPLGFFFIIMLSFPLGMIDMQDLSGLAAGLVWTGLLLAHLLILPRFFDSDCADGVMDILLMETELPSAMIIAKAAAIWMGAALPVVALAPFAGLMLGMAPHQLGSLLISALIGSIGLVLLGSFAAALTVGLRAQSWLAPLIILPLELPILIFGAQSAQAPLAMFLTTPASLILMALVLMALALAPPLAAFALKLQAN